jgi:hypothetical protein
MAGCEKTSGFIKSELLDWSNNHLLMEEILLGLVHTDPQGSTYCFNVEYSRGGIQMLCPYK